ncbi:hypothetical protein K443DRAFT_9228 [Laccaria amethystina LaAM-08-1]|uniref:Secreted protein n=1 Tax=Laccaria amethystina LaAM-08-1 TaxID=1095629 RepID=A0A0C9WZM6_9AGAR|nr:hypothetical protein K443DRAFT_9228 [Laccaria amethystina LaAM-08-1]
MRIRAILALGWLIASTDGRVDSGSRSCGDGVAIRNSSSTFLLYSDSVISKHSKALELSSRQNSKSTSAEAGNFQIDPCFTSRWLEVEKEVGGKLCQG